MTASNAPTRVAHHDPSRTSALLSPLGGKSCNCSKPARSFDQSVGFGGILGGNGSAVGGGSIREGAGDNSGGSSGGSSRKTFVG